MLNSTWLHLETLIENSFNMYSVIDRFYMGLKGQLNTTRGPEPKFPFFVEINKGQWREFIFTGSRKCKYLVSYISARRSCYLFDWSFTGQELGGPLGSIVPHSLEIINIFSKAKQVTWPWSNKSFTIYMMYTFYREVSSLYPQKSLSDPIQDSHYYLKYTFL